MKSGFCILIMLLLNLTITAQSVTGSWQGNISLPSGIKLGLMVHINNTPDGLTSTLDVPAQGAKALPIASTTFNNQQLQLTISVIQASYSGLLQGESISGSFVQNGQTFPLVLKKQQAGETAATLRPQEPQPPFDYPTKDISFKNTEQGNLLAGTLSLPKKKKDFPIVVMITGSGPQNRDGELLGHKPFLLLADYLARHGIGSLRLDDRGVGLSEPGKPDATSADFATDISSAVNYLYAQGYKEIGLLGHSEGGIIAPMVAVENAKVHFFVSMAGPSIPIDSMMLGQLKASLKLMNVPEAAATINVAVVKKAYAVVKGYKGQNLKGDLTDSLLKTFPLVPDMDKAVANTVATPWFQYFINFNPQFYIQKIKVPVLAINGSLDVQVLAKENLEGWKTGLQRAGNKNYEVKELQGLNHLFQQAQTGAPAEYGVIEQTIQPEALQLIADWILKVAK